MFVEEFRIETECGFEAITEVINILKSFYSESDCQKPVHSPIRYIFRGVTREYDEAIKSGSSVRLSNYRPKYRYADYINYNKNLITEARKNFPDSYAKLSDLEVLADIQHKGGATCLVDFSKNALIALWFACSGDYEDEGILYCYETIKDIIFRSNLSVLTTKDSAQPIESLLVETRKCANFRGKYSHKFWMWSPSCINDRISRQDSVFIFGLEKFDISEHEIQKIIIEPQAKKDILFVLAHCFNISALTIYHDVDGYADSNAKLKDIASNERNGNSGAYNNGFDNMLIGNYAIALDFFAQSGITDNNSPKNKNNLIELAYSKAVCYKHIGDYENAIMKYHETHKLCRDVLFRENQEGKETDYFWKKSFKAYNDELFLLYDLSLYDKCLECCDNIIELIEKYNDSHPDCPEKLDVTYCKIAKIELFLLKILREGNKNLKKYKDSYFNLLEIGGSASGFYHILLLYFRQFGEIYFGTKRADLKRFITDIEGELIQCEHNVVFSDWKFGDIKEVLQVLIDSFQRDSRKNELKKFIELRFLTSKMEDIQNIVHNNYLRTVSENDENDVCK